MEAMNYTSKDEGKIYWLLVLDSFLRPLQGFFNIFIYSRPNYYIRFRANYPELGRLWAILRKACLDPNIPKLPKGGSNTDDFNDTASRGDHRLTVGARGGKPRILSRSSCKRASYVSDSPVVREDSREESNTSELEDADATPSTQTKFPTSFRHKSPSKFSWNDDENLIQGVTASQQDLESGRPKLDGRLNTASTADNTNGGDGYSQKMNNFDWRRRPRWKTCEYCFKGQIGYSLHRKKVSTFPQVPHPSGLQWIMVPLRLGWLRSGQGANGPKPVETR